MQEGKTQNAQCHLIVIHPLSDHNLDKTVIGLDSTGKSSHTVYFSL